MAELKVHPTVLLEREPNGKNLELWHVLSAAAERGKVKLSAPQVKRLADGLRKEIRDQIVVGSTINIPRVGKIGIATKANWRAGGWMPMIAMRFVRALRMRVSVRYGNPAFRMKQWHKHVAYLKAKGIPVKREQEGWDDR